MWNISLFSHRLGWDLIFFFYILTEYADLFYNFSLSGLLVCHTIMTGYELDMMIFLTVGLTMWPKSRHFCGNEREVKTQNEKKVWIFGSIPECEPFNHVSVILLFRIQYHNENLNYGKCHRTSAHVNEFQLGWSNLPSTKQRIRIISKKSNKLLIPLSSGRTWIVNKQIKWPWI